MIVVSVNIFGFLLHRSGRRDPASSMCRHIGGDSRSSRTGEIWSLESMTANKSAGGAIGDVCGIASSCTDSLKPMSHFKSFCLLCGFCRNVHAIQAAI